jgi:hypothetical protein
VPRRPLVPEESSLSAELTSIVFLEMTDERAAITGEEDPIPGGIPVVPSREPKFYCFLGQNTSQSWPAVELDAGGPVTGSRLASARRHPDLFSRAHVCSGSAACEETAGSAGRGLAFASW